MPKASAFSIAAFRFNVTPPIGHALLGGLIPPAVGVDDALEAVGYVLQGAGAPVVVCAVDWAGLLNHAHIAWRTALGRAAGTTPERVAVHCVHPHNAPFVCPEARAATVRQPGLPEMFDDVFFNTCLERAEAAVRTAMQRVQPITHIAHGRAEVRQVASNRRVARDASNRVRAMRLSACEDPAVRALPEGPIDPTLQTIAFYNGTTRIVASHYYATHPMSYYRDGRVTSDFCGLARKRRQAEDPACTQIYFTGCAGDVAAGKYNDGAHANRVALADRIHEAIVASEESLSREPLTAIDWRTEDILPPPHATPTMTDLQSTIADQKESTDRRLLAGFRLGWLRRVESGAPIVLSRLRLNEASILHLPGEMFVAYQLRARAMRPDRPVLVAAYGDDGLWYVPTKEEYPAGGYEVTMALSNDQVDAIMTGAIRRLLA